MNRRLSRSLVADFGAHRFAITVGYDRAGALKEVFATSGKEGTDLAFLVADAAVLISLALQHGASVAELRHSMARLPGDGGDADPASFVGFLLDTMAGLELTGTDPAGGSSLDCRVTPGNDDERKAGNEQREKPRTGAGRPACKPSGQRPRPAPEGGGQPHG